MPDLQFDATTLKQAGLAVGATIATWANSGALGSAHAATALSGAGATSYGETPQGRPYANFTWSFLSLQGPGIAWTYSGGAHNAGATLVAVLKMPPPGFGNERVMDFHAATNCEYLISMRRVYGNSLLFEARQQSDYNDNRDSSAGGAGAWATDGIAGSRFQIFTGVSGPTYARTYADGALVGSISGMPPRSDRVTTSGYLGGSCWGSVFSEPRLTAQVHEVLVWRSALSKSQLNQLHMQLAGKWGLGLAVVPSPPPSPPPSLPRPPPPSPPPPPPPSPTPRQARGYRGGAAV